MRCHLAIGARTKMLALILPRMRRPRVDIYAIIIMFGGVGHVAFDCWLVQKKKHYVSVDVFLYAARLVVCSKCAYLLISDVNVNRMLFVSVL